MKLVIADAEEQQVKVLSLEQRDGEVVVTDGEWDYLVLRVDENGQMVFARLGGIDDDDVNTDVEGRIEEVEE